MSRKTVKTGGAFLSQAEGSIGTSLHRTVDNHYKGLDLVTAQTIRKANSDTDAAEIVTAIRRGRATEVLVIAASAASGAISGVLTQKAINNATLGGAPVATVLGIVPVLAGLAAPLSLSGRAVLTAGGLTYITGAVIYNLLTGQPKEATV